MNKTKETPFNTSLDTQIEFMELTTKIVTTPLNLAILESLKELREIKKSRIEELKNSKL